MRRRERKMSQAEQNKTEDLSPANLRRLYKLLIAYAREVRREQPLASQAISLVATWVEGEQRYDT